MKALARRLRETSVHDCGCAPGMVSKLVRMRSVVHAEQLLDARICRRADRLMPARETEAIILKTFPLGEADRLVSFLSRSQGRLRGVAAGARRLKNRFGSTLEILSHVEMSYVERETRDLVRIQQCDLLESFHAAQSDYALATALALVSEITGLVLPEREPAEAMFRLILLSAREIERQKTSGLSLSYFAFWTVRLGGWLPRFDRCGVCGKAFGSQPAYHAQWSPGLLCSDCRRAGMAPLSEAARHLGESFTSERLDKMPADATPSPAAAQLCEAALDWIEHHTERKLSARALLEKA